MTFGDYDPSEHGTRVCPRMPSRDLKTTAAFFDALGFKTVLIEQGEGYLIVRSGWVEIHFRPDPGMDPLRTAESCYIRMAEIDTVSAQLRTAVPMKGHPRFHSPVDRQWGLREAYLVDPDNNLIILGASIAEGDGRTPPAKQPAKGD